jgi:hypothetical protein
MDLQNQVRPHHNTRTPTYKLAGKATFTDRKLLKVRSAKVFPDRFSYADQHSVISLKFPRPTYFFPDQQLFPNQHSFADPQSDGILLADQQSIGHALNLS